MNRTEAMEVLITTLSVWPTSHDDAPSLPLNDKWWWHPRSVGNREMILADDNFDFITREDWSNARRHALGRPEDWPRAAMIQVQTRNGLWFFGTYEDAEPSEHGEWGGIGPGTWLNECAAEGRADIAGWDWTCSLTRREDILVSELIGEEAPADEGELPDGYHVMTVSGEWRAACNDRGWQSEGMPCRQDAVDAAWTHDFAATHAEPTPEEEEAMRAIAQRQASALGAAGGDPGNHYRRSIRVEIGAEDIDRGYVEIQLDPYRIADLYDLPGGPREHIFKKTLRGTSKGHDERQVAADIRSALDRWEEMLDEVHISYL